MSTGSVFGNNIYRPTSQKNYALWVDLEDWDNANRYASYTDFNVGDETSKYSLTVEGYSGTAGNFNPNF